MFSLARILTVGAIAVGAFNSGAFAAPLLCESTARNHMYLDSSLVSKCVDAGVGNIGQTGEGAKNDDFLKELAPGHGYSALGDQNFSVLTDVKTDTLNTRTGTFSFTQNWWNLYDTLLLGFKFGTGNTPDEWFVFELVKDVQAGEWTFVGVIPSDCVRNCKPASGGLSHVTVYGKDPKDPTPVPEPGSLALLGAALVGLAAARRRKI